MNNLPPNSSNNSWNPEEIPGHTTFLYRENRFREEHEYVYSWREEKALSSQLSLLNSQKLGKLTLLENLVTAQKEIDKLAEELSDLNDSSVDERERMQVILNEKQSQIYVVGSHIQEYAKKYDNLIVQFKEIQKFVDHNADCSYFELMNAGRQVNPNTCSCGFFQKKQFWNID